MEDGLRAGHVTGVQSCSLPIFGGMYGGDRSPPYMPPIWGTPTCDSSTTTSVSSGRKSISVYGSWPGRRPVRRSEERRVGKERRSPLGAQTLENSGERESTQRRD